MYFASLDCLCFFFRSNLFLWWIRITLWATVQKKTPEFSFVAPNRIGFVLKKRVAGASFHNGKVNIKPKTLKNNGLYTRGSAFFVFLFFAWKSLVSNKLHLFISSASTQFRKVMEKGLHERDIVGLQDFVLLEDCNSESAFIDNLKKRFQENLIYVSNNCVCSLRVVIHIVRWQFCCI